MVTLIVELGGELDVAGGAQLRAGERHAGVGVGEQALAEKIGRGVLRLQRKVAAADIDLRAGHGDRRIARHRKAERRRAGAAFLVLDSDGVLLQALIAAVEYETELAAVAGDEAAQAGVGQRVDVDPNRVGEQRAEDAAVDVDGAVPGVAQVHGADDIVARVNKTEDRIAGL